ncbi:MAG: FHA domain-containing protein [Anaerolineales bacterium]
MINSNAPNLKPIDCQRCGAQNPLRAIHCYACGHNLRDVMTSESQTAFVANPDDALARSLSQRKAFFARDAQLILRLPDDHIDIECPFDAQYVTLGRRVTTHEGAHIDLSAYDAKARGVSRIHARLTRIHAIIVLEDLGALNGTLVNAERISPTEPCVLANGDLVHLGSLAIEIVFHTPD